MVDIKDLWIGDRIRIKTSGRVGKFEGINKEGKARIAVDSKIILTAAVNLEKLPDEPSHSFDIDRYLEDEKVKEQKNKPTLRVTFEHTLDLHIEKLAPHMTNDMPQRILDYQLVKSENFVREAIEKHYPHITIIHGKGQGVLKTAIEHQLKMFTQVRYTFSKNQGGAVEIWLT